MDGMPVVYINLDRREDRKIKIQEEFNRMDVRAQRFSAISWKPGVVGNSKSHLKVIELAEENILVCEDDIKFMVSKEELNHKITTFLQQESEWNLVLLGYYLSGSEPYNEYLLQVTEAQAYCCYLIHSRYYDTFKKYLKASEKGLLETGRHWEYAIDQFCKKIQRSDNWLCFHPRLAKQTGGISDAGCEPVHVAESEEY